METFLCPNDRQLALRARLGTGWSSRGQSAQRQKTKPLSTEEEKQILKVIKRNETLAQSERNRVRLMLHRLECLKQVTTITKHNECAICKRQFGRLTNWHILCSHCHRWICHLCCQELTIHFGHNVSQIHKRNSLLNLPSVSHYSSQPNRLKNGNNYHKLNHQMHDHYSILNNLSLDEIRKSSVIHNNNNNNNDDNNNNINQNNCQLNRSSLFESINLAATHGQQLMSKMLFKSSSRHSDNRMYICKICYEAQQIWKRSGAWFYKFLPVDQMSNSTLNKQNSQNYIPNINNLYEFAKPVTNENDTEQWIQLQSKKTQPKPNRSKSICSPVSLATTKDLQLELTTTNQLVNNQEVEEFKCATNPPLTNSNNLLGLNRTSSLKIAKHFSPIELVEICQTQTQAQPFQSTNECEQTSPKLSYPTFHSTKSNTPTTTNVSNLTSSVNFNNINNKKVVSLTGEMGSKNMLIEQNHLNRRISKYINDDAPFGVLYFTLYHDTINTQLHVAIHKAKNLIAMDANGLSDPYVICELLPNNQHSTRPRTSTRPQCLNPVWNEALTFEPFDKKSGHHKILRLAILDEDLYGSDWLGEYRLSLAQLIPDHLTDFSVPLESKRPIGRGESDLACPTRGKIQLGLGYVNERKQLCIEIIKCADLAPMDFNGLSDPYVKLYLQPDKTKRTKQKTQIKKGTLFPEYNEKFYYDLQVSEAGSRTLEVTVWDFDRGPSNDFIGGLTLGANAKAERRELWLAVFRPPFRRIEAWFQLSKRNDNSNQLSTPGVCD